MIDPTKLLELKHARAVAELMALTVQANHDLNRGGWTCDWSIAIGQTIAELRDIELKLETQLAQPPHNN